MSRIRFFIAQGLMSFLPALLVMLVARGDKTRAADLSVVLAIVGATFSIVYFGQRSHISLRESESVSARQAMSFRLVMVCLGTVTALGIAFGLELSVRVVAFAVSVKASEAVIDLWVGLRIRESSNQASSTAFLVAACSRAATITLPVLVLGAAAAIVNIWVVAYLLGLATVIFYLVHLDFTRLRQAPGYRISPRALVAYGWSMRSFVSASAVCALVSSLPRILLKNSTASNYEASALALSIVPIFGLTFQAAWLGHLKRLSGKEGAKARGFIIEVALIALVTLPLWPLWRGVGRYVYRLESPEDLSAFPATICAAVAFQGAMSLANLFKAGPAPRFESIAYAAGIGGLLLGTVVFDLPIQYGLLLSGLGMLSGLAFGELRCRSLGHASGVTSVAPNPPANR